MTTIVTAAGLRHDALAFLTFKRAMGMTYRRGEFELNRFVHFVAEHWDEEGEVALDVAIRRWCERISDRKAVTLGNEFGVIRQLCLHRRRRDPISYVPEHAMAPVKESTFFPYIFSHDEVRRIIVTASAHKGRFIWARMFRSLILVLYCTGLRLGEAVRLQMTDVDLDHGTLMIQTSKGRSRIVPIRADLIAELQLYIDVRRQLLRDLARSDPGFLFLRRNGSPLPIGSASDAIRRILRDLGMKPPHGRGGARPYEFRHAFAVHRLTAWAEEGIDIHARLPSLSAYLGHVNVIGTEVYLKATPQLLELASVRFEQHLRHSRQPR
jgi:integrase/recombinase XerD